MSGRGDEEPQPQPPVAERVARRALVLAAVSCRGCIELDPGSEEMRRSVLEWSEAIGLDAEAEPEERRLLATPVGRLSSRERIDASWRSEGLCVLAWALRRADLAGYDQQCVPQDVARSLGFLEERPVALESPRLRPAEELGWLVDLTFTLHWRLREFSLRKQPMDFVRFATEAWFGPLETEFLAFADGDLAIDGVALARSPRWREVMSIARERQQAANWLAGDDPVYSEVTTDT
jgi:Domain of unknown function (DUF4272)